MSHYKKYSDGQVTSEHSRLGNLCVSIRGNSYEELFIAAAKKEAWDSITENASNYSELQIACLIGQRSDRRFDIGSSFDLKIVADFINSMGYDNVRIFDPHSDVTCALIERSVKVSPNTFIETSYKIMGTEPVIVSPDAGAYKKVYALAEYLNADLVAANKVRKKDGSPEILLTGDVNGRDCLIVDDIADGGRTFCRLAERLKEMGANKVALYVSHAMFNYGLDEIKKSIDKVFCTNSYRDLSGSKFINQFIVV